uniref:Uncharacterized protein n=1 Tax=Arundo donax TaxID=35708 RepID=A0A0A9AMJ0_ARUDO
MDGGTQNPRHIGHGSENTRSQCININTLA